MNLNALIDHTVLKATATRDDVARLCDEAVEHGFASVCVNTCWVPMVAERLAGTPVKTCCVVGFPLGAMATDPKAYEAKWAVDNGADEVDMVLNVGWLLEGADDAVREDRRFWRSTTRLSCAVGRKTPAPCLRQRESRARISPWTTSPPPQRPCWTAPLPSTPGRTWSS